MTGILCPECGSKTDVKDSRPEKGKIRRRRECKNGHRFSTHESVLKARPKNLPKPKPKARVANADLPLTYLSAAQKIRARQFFSSGWTIAEVAPLFDMTPQELRK